MPNRRAVLDTNVFGIGANLGTPLWVSLKRLCAEVGITLCIPDVVLREAVNLRREQYQEAAQEFLEANKKIGRFFDLPGVYVPDADEVAANWETELRNDFEVVESAAADALDALEREASRIAPARGGRGARDSLIWLTCLRLAADGDSVVLVSRNTKDFADRAGKALNAHLVAEVTGAGVDLTYLPSLDALFDLVADKIEGPDVLDTEPYERLLGFDFWDFILDSVEWEGFATVDVLAIDVSMSDLRCLRAYAANDRGLALIDGLADVVDERIGEEPTPMRFMAWVEFDLETKKPIGAEIERMTLIEAATG